MHIVKWGRYIKEFVSYLKIEKGLSENSIFAYQQDVAKLEQFASSI
ncbi:MAG: site-specific integrase, partial [Dolichospermum sp.]